MKINHILMVGLALAGILSCKSSESQSDQNTTVAKNISVSELEEVQTSRKALLLDVRTPEEVADGMIEGAEHVDFYSDTFMQDVAKYDKNQPIIIYCRSGGRSANAMQMMHDAGWTELYNLKGGYNAYSKK